MSSTVVSKVLRRLRKQRKWTQVDLAEAAGISRPQISRYEWGGVMPRRKNLVKLADALDCSPELLQTGRETPDRGRTNRGTRARKLIEALQSSGR